MVKLSGNGLPMRQNATYIFQELKSALTRAALIFFPQRVSNAQVCNNQSDQEMKVKGMYQIVGNLQVQMRDEKGKEKKGGMYRASTVLSRCWWCRIGIQ